MSKHLLERSTTGRRIYWKMHFSLSILLPFTDIFKMIFWKPFPVANVLKGKYVGFFNNLHLKSIWMRFISSPRSYTSLRDKELVRPMKKKKHCQYSKVSWHQVCMKSLFERHLNSVANYINLCECSWNVQFWLAIEFDLS